MQHALLLYSVDGRLLSKFQAYDVGLGVINAEWCPSGPWQPEASLQSLTRALDSIPVCLYGIVRSVAGSRQLRLDWESFELADMAPDTASQPRHCPRGH